MKNLVYYTLNSNYNEVLKISLLSLRKYYHGDVLIMSDENNIQKLKLLLDDKNIFFMTVKSDPLFFAASNKFLIYKYENIEKYDKVLYLDCDTVVVNDINYLFKEKMLENKFLVTPYTQSYGYTFMYCDWHGGTLFEDVFKQKIIKKFKKYQIGEYDPIKNNDKTLAINSGIFCFKVTDINLKIFDEMYNHCIFDYNHNKRNFCLEQPYLNYHLHESNLHHYYNFILNDNEVNLSEIYKYYVVHVLSGIGASVMKVNKMKIILEFIKDKKFDIPNIQYRIDNTSNQTNKELLIYENKK